MKRGFLKKFFEEFKTFITRGNVLDLSVGIIVGSAFTSIVTVLTKNVFEPLINLFLKCVVGADSLSGVYTMLSPTYGEDGKVILEESIFIDWGALFNAVIYFLIVAFVLFFVVKAVNALHSANDRILREVKRRKRKELKRLMREEGLSRKEAKARYLSLLQEETAALQAEEERKKKEAEEAKKAEEENKADVRLLREILELLKEKGGEKQD